MLPLKCIFFRCGVEFGIGEDMGDPSLSRDCPLDCKVYVGNLGNSGNKTELERAFGYYGPLRSVWVARNPPGFAFVEFEDPRDAADAVRELDGRKLSRNASYKHFGKGDGLSPKQISVYSGRKKNYCHCVALHISLIFLIILTPDLSVFLASTFRSPRRQSFSRSRSRSLSRERRRERSLSNDRNYKPSRSFSRSRSRSRSNGRK
ncbi:serine/arginine-rich splicing factor 3a [Pseudorasbora parva]|uniref:serine/arginine-rich splicing factor 3a n=1 Tax=Pseudorasbora parva TaxID=51549 RepID=UPI00351F13F8